MIRPSLVRLRKAEVLTHSAAFSPTNVMHRSTKEAAHLAPVINSAFGKIKAGKIKHINKRRPVIVGLFTPL